MNEIGQRTGVTVAGSTLAYNTSSWLWGYDPLGQVTTADSSADTGDRAYEFDTIGNRKKSVNSLTLPGADNYTSNPLNQYTSVQLGGTGVSPEHDFDGNATAYPLPVAPAANSILVWDAENRLISTTVGTTTTTYLYDAYSRRIARIHAGRTTRYLYDGWNRIAEYAGANGYVPDITATYLWGLDLSGTLQGAGGVGGLLAMKTITPPVSGTRFAATYYPVYDGNGNIGEYLSMGGGIYAHFEYDAFGNTIGSNGNSYKFSFAFSTKSRDPETGLYYYGKMGSGCKS